MTINASAHRLQIQMGADLQDWSKALKTFDVGFNKRDRGGLLQITGTLVLHFWQDAPESMSPRLNPARWHRGQLIKIAVSDSTGTLQTHPCGLLYILKEPAPSSPDRAELSLQVGCILSLRDFVEPDNDKAGVILGVATSRTTAIANILAAANIPTPSGTVPLYPLSHPLPKIGGSYVQQAGKVAYAGLKALYQDRSGNIQAVDLTLNPSATPVVSFSVGPGGGEIVYSPSEGAETPVEELRVVGLDRIGIDTWRCLSSQPQENYQTNNSGSGAITRLLRRTIVTDCQGLDSNGFFYKSRREFVEEVAGSVYPNDEPGSQRLTFSSDTTTDYYYEPGMTGRLISIRKLRSRPFAAAVASFWGNLSAAQKLTYSRISPTRDLDELTSFTYVDYPTPQDGSVADQYAFNYQAQVVTGQVVYSQAPVATLITDPTELTALGSPSPSGLVPSGRVTESWAKVRGYEWQKTTITESPFISANPDGAALSTTLSAKIALVTTDQTTDISAAGGQQPAAPERRPDRYTEMELQIKGRALFGQLAGTTEQKRFRSIEVEYMISNDQAAAIAQMEGAILIGRRQGQTISTAFSDAFLNNPVPLPLWKVTEPDGTAYIYQADAIQYSHDEDRAVVGWSGIWAATIPAATTAVKLPYLPIMPFDGGIRFGGNFAAYPYSLAPQSSTFKGGIRFGGSITTIISATFKGGIRLGGTFVGRPASRFSGGLRLGGNFAFAGSKQLFNGGLRFGGNFKLSAIASTFKGGIRFGGNFAAIIYESETIALLARFGGTYNATRKDAVNALIKGLKTDGTWSLLDVLQIYAANTSGDALLNWKGTSYTASLVNSPTFTTDRGFTTNGSSSYVTTGFNPTGASQYALNSASFGLYSRTSGDDGGIDAGATIGADAYTSLVIRRSSGVAFGICNSDSGGFFTGSVANGLGLLTVTRTGSTAVRLDKNGTSIATDSTTSGSVPNGALYVGCRNDSGGASNFAAREFTVMFAGASLTTTQSAALYSRLQTYLTAIGANV